MPIQQGRGTPPDGVRGTKKRGRGVPVEPPRSPLSHQEEPLAFGGEVLRRAATAVEPAIGRSIREPRTLVFTLSASAAVIAAALVVVAGWKIVDARRLRGAETVPDRAVARASEGPRMARVALSPDEESRVISPKSAMYRDRWRQDVWFHPLTGEMRLPENPTRKFGAKRHGKRPVECGRGHCGVDVGEFGLTVHAVRDGVIERCQRIPKDNAGRYLRIAHDDGFVSYYIHLNSIRDDLKEGMRVKGGEEIGITGKTGIKRSRPHLHFQLAYRDENGNKYFIDPEPLLKRSVSTSALDDVAAAKAADALVVASRPPALDDGVEAGGEHKVHKRRHKHSTEDDSPE
jgi:murein DD-endopeptidase MepM/ murein hydrolase activator NlpD